METIGKFQEMVAYDFSNLLNNLNLQENITNHCISCDYECASCDVCDNCVDCDCDVD